jgi:hypothetical protein
MAYNRRNKLLQMKSIIDCYLEHKTDGNTTMYVWRCYIYPRYQISLSTLYNYLATPVDKMLKEETEMTD